MGRLSRRNQASRSNWRRRNPPYIRYVKWEPPQTGPDLAHAEVANLRAEVAQLRAAVGDLPAVVKAMQESICHLELQVHRLLNQEGEL